jgi:hypothetical protein
MEVADGSDKGGILPHLRSVCRPFFKDCRSPGRFHQQRIPCQDVVSTAQMFFPPKLNLGPGGSNNLDGKQRVPQGMRHWQMLEAPLLVHIVVGRTCNFAICLELRIHWDCFSHGRRTFHYDAKDGLEG